MSRPARFAAVDNEAIDTLPSILAIGLLTRLIRAKDGDDVTVESLSKEYDEGEKALSKAMRMLVDHANVVKFKIQRATTETVIEGGQEIVKRGGSWYTTFSVDSIPFTAEDVAEMLEDIYAEGNVKCHRVEPARLDPRSREPLPAPRPTPPKGGVGPTCGNDANAQDRPTPPSPGVGEGGAHIRKKTSYACEGDGETDVPSARSAVDVRRTDTSGSSEVEGESGCAAAAEEGSSSDQEDGQAGVPGPRRAEGPELSREQLAAVRAVEAVIPPVLLALLPYQQFPKRNRPAVLAALESRTVEQLAERVARRWEAYGYEPALHDGKMTNPVGAALELIVAPRYCPDLSCEDGVMVDTGADCTACLERRERRRAAHAAGELVPNGHSGGGSGRAPECVICQRPFPGAVPDNGECAVCVREAEAAFAALSARMEASSGPATVPDAPAAPEPAQKAAEEPVVDEETARLRAMYARQYGTPDQIAAYCTEAPF